MITSHLVLLLISREKGLEFKSEKREQEAFMEALEAILTRRSIRQYTSQSVTDDTVTELLKAAMSAPTAGNEPWHFVVIRDRTTLNAVPKFHVHSQMLKQAQVAIAVCGDPAVETLKRRWLMDCAAATENILIAANALGLGACWVGIYPVEERIQALRELLGIPDHVVPLCVVSIGYPAEKKAPSTRFRPELVHNGKW
jgi:nitroreductase